MNTLTPKEFIKSIFIEKLGSIIGDQPYISFMVIGIGIEFLGKCTDRDLPQWNVEYKSKEYFEKAITSIPSLQKYMPYLDLNTYYLYNSLRCGLAHAASPKYIVTLSSKEELGHLVVMNSRLNLKIEDFYHDFKEACEFVINDTYPPGNKMENPFLQIPDDDIIDYPMNAEGIIRSYRIFLIVSKCTYFI